MESIMTKSLKFFAYYKGKHAYYFTGEVVVVEGGDRGNRASPWKTDTLHHFLSDKTSVTYFFASFDQFGFDLKHKFIFLLFSLFCFP